ncbi:hypothetical protein WA158_007291 [Blastocystis sp. Blastoise]
MSESVENTKQESIEKEETQTQVVKRNKYLEKYHFPNNVDGLEQIIRLCTGTAFLLVGCARRSFGCIFLGMGVAMTGAMKYSPIYHVLDYMEKSDKKFKLEQSTISQNKRNQIKEKMSIEVHNDNPNELQKNSEKDITKQKLE